MWERELSEEDNRLAEALVGDRLDRYGYPRQVQFPRYAIVFPGLHNPGKYETSLKTITDMGVRLWKKNPNEHPKARIYLGSPDQSWLGDRKSTRLIKALIQAGGILRAILTNKFIFWIPDPTQDNWPGYAASLLEKLLNPYRVSDKQAAKELAAPTP